MMYLHHVDTRYDIGMTLPCACTTVRKANRALFRYYENAMLGSGVSITQFSIFRALKRRGKTPLSDLADELIMERTSLYRTIAPLETSGAVKITPSKQGRAKTAELTNLGHKMMYVATPHWERAQSTIVGAIGEEQWRVLSETPLGIPTLVEE